MSVLSSTIPMSAAVSQLAAQGSYPALADDGWQLDVEPVRPVIDAYFERSIPFIDPASSSIGEMERVYSNLRIEFPSNEPRYIDAIGSIDGRGDVFIGAGHIMPIIYGGWARASHVYAVDIFGELPLCVTPFWGALFCMSRNRSEFLSLLSGRPVSSDVADSLETRKPDEIIRAVMDIPFDASFSHAVADGLIELLSSSDQLPPDVIRRVIDTRYFRRGGTKPLYDHRKIGSMFAKGDSEGRGGPLSSSSAFEMCRNLFLEGRMTGVASDIVGSGMDMIVKETERQKTAIRTIYISNIPDWMHNRVYGFNELNGYTWRDRRSALEYMYRFYDRLSKIPYADDAVVVSTLDSVYTMAFDLSQYVRASIPLSLPPVEGGRVARRFYRLHNMLFPSFNQLPKDRLQIILNGSDVDGKYKRLMEAVSAEYSESELSPVRIKEIVAEKGLRNAIPEWEQDMLINFLACVGVVTMKSS